ncbi:MAG: cysteine dioxygenase [Marinilabiliales bacterium]|nr:MAG: cysteine dioxygenase [Marinilabiliales bacterium]
MESLPESIQKLIKLIEAKDYIDNSMVKEYLLEANIKKSDLQQFATFDHPVNESYGRRPIYDNGNFKIVIVTWNPGDFSAIHSHGYVDWGIIRYFGEGQRNVYHLEDDLISMIASDIMANGSYEEITSDLIHQTGNNSDEPIFTLHVYGSNRKENNIMDDTEVFDIVRNKTHFTDGTAFLNLASNLIARTDKCPHPDKDTFFYNCILELQYFNRQEYCKNIKDNIDYILNNMSDYYI